MKGRRRMTKTKGASRHPKTNDSQTLNKRHLIIAYLFGFIKFWIPEHREQILTDILMVALGSIGFGLVFIIGRLICSIFGMC